MGMPQSRHERNAATHSGRYIGWLMGIEPRWLPTDERSALMLLYQMLLSLSHPDETSIQLAGPMLDEPLQRPYPRFAALRGRFDRARHLSISRLFLGRAVRSGPERPRARPDRNRASSLTTCMPMIASFAGAGPMSRRPPPGSTPRQGLPPAPPLRSGRSQRGRCGSVDHALTRATMIACRILLSSSMAREHRVWLVMPNSVRRAARRGPG